MRTWSLSFNAVAVIDPTVFSVLILGCRCHRKGNTHEFVGFVIIITFEYYYYYL